MDRLKSWALTPSPRLLCCSVFLTTFLLFLECETFSNKVEMLTKHPPNPSIIYSDAYWSGRTASSSKENFPWIPWHSSGGTSTDCGGRNPVLITQVKNGGQGLKHVYSPVATGLPFLTPPKGRNYAVPINRRADWWNTVYTQIEYYSAIKEKKHWHKMAEPWKFC